MARVGIKWSTTAVGADASFSAIKAIEQGIIDAGFKIEENTIPATFDTVPGEVNGVLRFRIAGAADQDGDDTPHFVIHYYGDPGWLPDHACGLLYRVLGTTPTDSPVERDADGDGFWPSASNPPDLWFAADGTEGWFWLLVVNNDGEVDGCTVGCSSRRYAADLQKGLCARYGLIELLATAPKFVSPWMMYGEGTFGVCDLHLVSAFSGVNDLRATRPAGSAMPRMAAPIFLRHDGSGNGPAPFILGELNGIMATTDGYALSETVMPGWIAINIPSEVELEPWRAKYFALPAPDEFQIIEHGTPIG